MNLNKVDLNLFIVFDAIYTEANLTRAGQIVGITQPAVSNALSRLRETFNDPLFVRTARHGADPYGAEHHRPGAQRAAVAAGFGAGEPQLRSWQANKTYRISMTDLTEAVILPAVPALAPPGAERAYRASSPSAARPPRNSPPAASTSPSTRR